MSAHIEKARLLMAQSRFELATKELRQQLAEEPDDPFAHALLAICLGEQKPPSAESLRSARTAVSLAPDFPFAHYVLAGVLHDCDKLSEAEQAIREAIRLEPQDADYFSLLASINLSRRRWAEALQAAEQGLAVDAEHVASINLRAMALGKMNRRYEAGAEIGTALGVDPDNPLTHANQGWHHIELGEYQQATNHFREALRLEPQLDWAREGIVEVLKARNPVYRLMLRYFLWTAKLQGRGLWIMIIGAWLFSRLIRGLINSQPVLAPLLWPIYIAYLIFVLLTWIAKPLFNLTLRFDPLGRIALTREQIKASNWVGALLVVALLGAVVWLVTEAPAALALGIGSGMMTVPVSASLSSDATRGRSRLLAYTVFLAAVGVLTLLLIVAGSELAVLTGALFFLGFFLFGLVANYYAART